jgi:hypothetical protein
MHRRSNAGEAVITDCMRTSDESASVSQEDLRQVQGRASQGCRAGHLHDREAQAAAGVGLDLGAGGWGLGLERAVVPVWRSRGEEVYGANCRH